MSNLRKTFGGLVAVDSVGFAVERGSITGLIGPNGSGKSTLFNLIAGTMKADSGSVYLEGEKIDDLSADKRFHRGMVRSLQDPRLFFGMNVFENMLVPPAKQKGEGPSAGILPSRWKAQEIELGKKAKEVMTDLEGLFCCKEQRRRDFWRTNEVTSIRETLMNSPKLILLDEPTAGVAPALTNSDLLKKLRSEEN